MSLRKGIIIILISILSYACKNDNKSDILLQIGSYKLTAPEYEILNNFKGEMTIQQLNNQIINNGYILAHAIDLKYDTIGSISKKLKYMMYDKAAKIEGFVWNKKVKPNLALEEDEIKQAYKKSAMEYSLEILYFPTKEWLNKFISLDTKIESLQNFYILKKKVSSTEEVKLFQVMDHYPFYPLGAYNTDILHLKKDDVFGPLETLSGYYVVHIVGTQNKKQPAYKDAEKDLKNALIKTLTEKYIWENEKEIFSKANVTYNETAINDLSANYNSEKREWTGKDNNTELMKYTFHESVQSYTIGDLTEFIHSAPIIQGTLPDRSCILGCLKTYINYIYLYEDAKKLHMDEDEEVALYMKRYREGYYLDYYFNKHIVSNINITSQDMLNYYEEKKADLAGFKFAKISICKFLNESSAYQGFRDIRNKQRNSNSNIKPFEQAGLFSSEEYKEIHISDTVHSPLLIQTISEMKDGDVSMPFKMGEEFWVISLHSKYGNEIIPFKYMEGNIKSILFNKRFQEISNSLIAELKIKYPINVNLLEQYANKNKN